MYSTLNDKALATVLLLREIERRSSTLKSLTGGGPDAKEANSCINTYQFSFVCLFVIYFM